MGAHLDDVLEGLLGFVLEVGGALAFLHHVDSEETGWNISLSQIFRVVWGVTTDLTERPGSGGLDVVLWLVDESILEWGNTLGDNDGHGKGVIEGGDVTEGHDTGETCVTLGLADIVNGSSGTTGVDDELGELSGLLGNLTDAGGSILTNLNIDILEAVEDSGEDLSLDNDFGQIDGMLGDLGEALADITLELGIGVGDEGSKVGDGTLVNDSLGKFFGVLGDLRESGGGDALEGELGLLDTKDKKTNGTSIDNRLSEVSVVLSNA